MSNSNAASIIGGFLAGLAIGGVIGAAVALLLAPQSGEETRRQIEAKAEELRGRAELLAEDTRKRVEAASEDLRKRVEKPA